MPMMLMTKPCGHCQCCRVTIKRIQCRDVFEAVQVFRCGKQVFATHRKTGERFIVRDAHANAFVQVRDASAPEGVYNIAPAELGHYDWEYFQ